MSTASIRRVDGLTYGSRLRPERFNETETNERTTRFRKFVPEAGYYPILTFIRSNQVSFSPYWHVNTPLKLGVAYHNSCRRLHKRCALLVGQ